MRNIMSRPNHQSGAALALSLVAMAILTIIGIAAMNSTLLQMLLAGNMQFQSTALTSAENTLVTAERVARALPLATKYSAAGQYNIANDGDQDPLAAATWASAAVANGDAKNLYIVEHAGAQKISGNSAAWGQKSTGVTVNIVWVTAHSEGTKSAVRRVQSIYVQ